MTKRRSCAFSLPPAPIEVDSVESSWRSPVGVVSYNPGVTAVTVPGFAQALQLSQCARSPSLEQLIESLRGHAALIVLDNVEQLVAAAPLFVPPGQQAPVHPTRPSTDRSSRTSLRSFRFRRRRS